MGRILELDVFSPSSDNIKWKGKDFEVIPVRVDALLRVMQAVQNLEDAQKPPEAGKEQPNATDAAAAAMQEILGFVQEHVPTIPVKELSIGELMAIVQFAATAAGEKAQGVAAEGPQTQKKTE